MSDNIPFEIQTEIIKRFPVISLVRFRSVSKKWKSLIDSSYFINTYHICHTQPQHHLLVRYKLGADQKHVSIADDDTFPQHKFSLTVPRSVNLLERPRVLCSSHGLICFFGYNNELGVKKRERAVIWNPSVRKCVDVIVPNVVYAPFGYTVVGFGVCPNTGDSKLVKVNNWRAYWSEDSDRYYDRWEVEVFSLSSRVWKWVSIDPPLKPCHLSDGQVCIDGFIYWPAFDNIVADNGVKANMIISYDLTSEVFGEVSLPDCLVHTHGLLVYKRDECLALLEHYEEDDIRVCGIWMMKDGITGSFAKMFTVKVPGWTDRVLEFRKNGEAIRVMKDDTKGSSRLEVYEPCSQHINDIGISGNSFSFAVTSYVETLLLLDCSDSIIPVAS